MRRLGVRLSLIGWGIPLGLVGCSPQLGPHDPWIDKDKKSFRAMASEGKFYQPATIPPPKENPIVIPKIFQQKISIDLNDSVICKKALMYLFRQAGLGSSWDSAIKEGVPITYQAYRQPLIQILDDICRLQNWRFKVRGNQVSLKVDTPYMKTHEASFLLATRKTETKSSVATSLFSGASSSTASGSELGTGSSSTLSGEASVDFWKELETNIKAFLESSNSQSPSSPQKDGRLSTQTISEKKKIVSEQEPKKVQALYTLHKQAGLLSIYATQRQHRWIQDYLKRLRKSILTQVSIEAKIVEVTLTEEFKSGINWTMMKESFVAATSSGAGGSVPGTFPFEDGEAPLNILSLGGRWGDLSVLTRFVERFGTVRTLSSPRITVLNNQPAVLRVAKNEVFFRLEVARTVHSTSSKFGVETVQSRIHTVPIGLVMVVHPFIQHETGDIVLTIRPTVSRIVDKKPDPAVALQSDNSLESVIPVVQVREMDSVLKARSGEVIVLGGLMEEQGAHNSRETPGLGSLPLVGGLFRAREDERYITELIVFLRVTVVNSPNPHPKDKERYQEFFKDPRPFF